PRRCWTNWARSPSSICSACSRASACRFARKVAPDKCPTWCGSTAGRSSTTGPSTTRHWARSSPTCWCTRSATTSGFPTTTWPRSRRRRADRPRRYARQRRGCDCSVLVRTLAPARASSGRALVFGLLAISQRLALANAAERVEARGRGTFAARREDARTEARAAGLAYAPCFGPRRLRQQHEQSDQDTRCERLSHRFTLVFDLRLALDKTP